MESFGPRLKREREKKGITLDDISLSTKIGTRLLRALEDEHFDQLPGGIFNKGFVRAYARHLGMNEDQAVTDYLAASGETPPSKNIDPQIAEGLEAHAEPPANGVAQIPWGVLAIALTLVALGFAVWGFNSREKDRESREEKASPPKAAIVVAKTADVPNTASTPAPALAAASPASDTAQTPPATSSGVVAPGEFVVLIRAHDESWISTAADGAAASEATLVAETEKSIHAKNSVTIRAGNVGALDFFFNGKKLPPQGGEEEVKTLTFTSEGLQPPKPVVP